MIATIWIAIITTYLVVMAIVFYLLFRTKKGILNPEIEEFEASIKERGLILGEARGYKVGITIEDTKEFVNFAIRNKVGTIFKSLLTLRSDYYKTIRYFYIHQGKIISTRINKFKS